MVSGSIDVKTEGMKMVTVHNGDSSQNYLLLTISKKTSKNYMTTMNVHNNCGHE